MSTSLVSIIIPTFNRASIINDTLDSILDQTYSNWECLVVDDGSTDETKKVIHNYASKDSRIIALERPQEKNKGANSCRNYGLSIAKGNYVIFFDSDDIMAPTCLEKRVEAFNKYENKDFLVFSMGIFREKYAYEIPPNRKVVNLPLDKTIEDFILSVALPWNVCRPIFKTSLIQNKIGFNEKIHNFQDDEFHIRLLSELKPDYLSIDITDCYYRYDEVSLKKYESLSGYQNIVNCFNEYYTTVFKALNEEQKQKLNKQLKRKFFNQLSFYVIPKINRKVLFETIKLFDEKIGFTFKEKMIFNLVLFLNKYYYQKKGYYLVLKQLKKTINNNL
jgi:glycosyltransferase involved in cell wall biosynthesis